MLLLSSSFALLTCTLLLPTPLPVLRPASICPLTSSRYPVLQLSAVETEEESLPPPALTEALGSERAAEVWARRPPGALPNNKRQVALIDWLQQGPLAYDPERFLYPCLRREPKLLLRASSLPALREAHATLSSLLREQDAPGRCALALAHEPTLLVRPAQAIADAAASLQKATGLDDAQLARVLRAEPGLLLASEESIGRRLAWLDERLGISRGGRLQRVLLRAPLALLMTTSNMESRLGCLLELGVPEELHGPIVVRTPRLLHWPPASIRSRAGWLRDSRIIGDDGGSEGGGDGLEAFLRRQPDFFSRPTREYAPILEWLTNLGLDSTAAGALLAAEPAVLNQPLDQLVLRANFFVKVLGGTLEELCTVPHMLTCDLAKVPMLRYAYCLTNAVDVTPTQLLTKGDAAFCELVASCDLEDLNSFERAGNHLNFFQGAEM
jgi:hypothetical protein